MKKIMLVLACVMMTIGIQAKDVVTKVAVEELPEKAQKFIKEHFHIQLCSQLLIGIIFNSML